MGEIFFLHFPQCRNIFSGVFGGGWESRHPPPASGSGHTPNAKLNVEGLPNIPARCLETEWDLVSLDHTGADEAAFLLGGLLHAEDIVQTIPGAHLLGGAILNVNTWTWRSENLFGNPKNDAFGGGGGWGWQESIQKKACWKVPVDPKIDPRFLALFWRVTHNCAVDSKMVNGNPGMHGYLCLCSCH